LGYQQHFSNGISLKFEYLEIWDAQKLGKGENRFRGLLRVCI